MKVTDTFHIIRTLCLALMLANNCVAQISAPTVSVTSTPQIVGQAVSLDCSVTTVASVSNSAVNVKWRSNGVVLQRVTGVGIANPIGNTVVYIHSYIISRLTTTDDGRAYQCEVSISATPPVNATDNIILDVIVPTPNITVVALNPQIVGQSLTLECNITTVRGVTSRVDIVWNSNDMELERIEEVDITSTPENSVVYRDIYTISQLTTTDNDTMYRCEVVINTSPPIMANYSVTLHLDVMVPAPTVSVTSTPQIVGQAVSLDCSVTTVASVSNSAVNVTWRSNGVVLQRVTGVGKANPIGNTVVYIHSYIISQLSTTDDSRAYQCEVSISATPPVNATDNIILDVIVPTPNINVVALKRQIVGQSLTLECNVTTVKGITSRVDIVWNSNDTELERMEGVNISTTTDNSVVYRDIYTISQLTTTDNGTMYQCEVVINTGSPVMANYSVTLQLDSMGFDYQRCFQNDLDGFTQCINAEIVDLQESVNKLEDDLNTNRSIIDILYELQGISEELGNVINGTSGNLSLTNLNTTIGIIDTVSRIIKKTTSALTENGTIEVVDVILNNVTATVSDMLSDANSEVFLQSDKMGVQSIGEDFLRTIENFALAVGNVTSATNKSGIFLNEEDIIIDTQLVTNNTTLINTIVFPNDTIATKFGGVQITIPSSALQLALQRLTEDAVVTVVNFVANNLQLYINDPSLRDRYSRFRTLQGVVISTQISQGSISQLENSQHVTLKFNLENTCATKCVFWMFSTSNRNTGRWSSDGIIQDENPSPPVICNSTHLTSFSVLVSSVDAAEDSPELHIVSYVGCGVSIVCLLLTIGTIILLRKTAFKAKHHMIHLNLSVALLFGLVVFVSGVDRAEDWWCNMVAILLHYFFLCVFCWTLCEAIMIYMMFVELFYKGIFQDMRFFLLLGWGLPIPIVAISAGLSYDNYVIDKNINTTSCMDEYNIDMEMDNTSASETEIIACWISDKDGSIWAFAGPVILILMINVTLFMLSLLSIIRSRRTRAKMTDTLKANYETAKILLSSTVVLLPLLGGTWLLGLLFLINKDSVELAWIFTVVNSLQGVGIFFFHVVRNKEVKNVIERKFKQWRKERKLKSSLKDTTTQKQIMKSNFTLQNKSTSMEETEYPSTKDSSHPQNQ